MFFKKLLGSEIAGHVPGGDLGYSNKEDNAKNVGQLYGGKPFVWPEEFIMPIESTALMANEENDPLVDQSEEEDLPEDYQADLQPDLPFSEASACDNTDPVLLKAAANIAIAKGKIVQKYAKKQKIKSFVQGDIMALNLPKGTTTSTDNKRVWAKILAKEHPNRYRLQTKWGVLKTLVPTRELNRAARLVADSIDPAEYKGGNKRILLSLVALKASLSVRVAISCKCKGKCGTNRCSCFKNKKKCSVYCHYNSEHDCGYLASLALRTKVALIKKEKEAKSSGKEKPKARSKRRRANTARDDVNIK
jgi:hypothetical protein